MFYKFMNFYYKMKYRHFLDRRVSIDKTAFIHHAATFIVRNNPNASINVGEGAYIGRYNNIHTNSNITIGKDSVLSDYVFISTLSHGFDPSAGRIMSQEDQDKGPVILGDNVFIGFAAKILPNVKLGEWTIVGAGSVVTKSYPDGFVMIAGNPAKVIKRYDHDNKNWING
ncbi:acyltransferase [Ewingella americana]|jgi:maltose O-acetyltransferase|uniref:Putative transferase n=1 Tax=Ewingella americana (strain ATCC 33852 / DSM 4580 / CCUG 14506 / JCM 5911 / LMG 7869 / NCTC 12157 / CDC 1468-78) TaxID=910964 RepID=A0A085GHB9_EWIA3|nr:acyltransferase [Ewingella americana]KAA8729503.1 acyltransferase [Ewingella americana]KFC83114.1 putative transferase [Ewingella americana ATCC 33852]